MKQFFAVILISISSFAFAEPKIEGTVSELQGFLEGVTELVHIEGSATSKVSSDRAVIKLLIWSESPSLAKALASNSKIRKSVRGQLKGAGIDDQKVKEYKFSSTPEYGLFGDEPKSYRVENILSVVVASEEQMVKVASISDSEKNIRYVSSNAEVGDRDKIRADLLNKALSNAKEKASIYESQLGVRLAVVSFKESSFKTIEAQEVSSMRREKMAGYSSGSASYSQFGESKFTMAVTVKYRLKAK